MQLKIGRGSKFAYRQVENQGGYSLVELVITTVISLVVLGATVSLFTTALDTRRFQIGRTDALVSAQAAINVMSREIGNSGFGLERGEYASNGLVLGDCNATRLHFRTNTGNLNSATTDAGENVTFYLDTDPTDSTLKAIVRHDNATGERSGIINQVSNVTFTYYDYDSNGTATAVANPSVNTARVRMTLTVVLADDKTDFTNKRNVTIESDISLRNAPYNIGQY
jgi:Tfp pilus assembly protein PilW